MTGKKVKWTIERIKEGFNKFYSLHKRYPTTTEIDSFPSLPSSRQIQRRFGGLPALRKQLNLSGPTDFTTGQYSSDRAHSINDRSHKLEQTVYEFLIDRFGKPFVHREYFFTDDKRTRTDFFVYWEKGNFAVDVFYPKDKHNLLGCLNSKMRTYKTNQLLNYPVIFLMMNDDIGREKIALILSNKKIKLRSNQSVMLYDQFKDFCKEKSKMKV
jgi:hypothetical protein